VPDTSDWSCPVCGALYRDERCPITFADAYAAAFRASVDAAERGDYSVRATSHTRKDGTRGRPRAVLAIMHEAKAAVWEFHLATCAEFGPCE
jgi:hypothetical protein